MKKWNKIISIVIAFALVVCMLPRVTPKASAAPKVSKITLSKPLTSLLVLKKGKTFQLKAKVTVKPNKAKYKKLGYRSSKPKVISVSAKGKLKALKAKGSAKITVFSKTNKKKSATLTVKVGKPVTKLVIADQTIQMSSSNELAVNIKPASATCKELVFKSANEEIATFTGGRLNGFASGTTTMTAETTDGSNVKTKFKVTVVEPDCLKDTSFKTMYPNFKVGVAIPASVLMNESTAASRFVNYHCNSVTMENDMKPESMLDWEGCEANAAAGNDTPVIKFDTCDKVLSYAKEHGLSMRYHTFVWYSQTPEFFFHEGYDTDKPYVSKEKMLARMQSYITQIIDHIETNYPGVIYAWDVVNEAIGDGPTGDANYFNARIVNNNWYTTVGSDFIKKAFEYADAAISKYPTTAQLFYNDYYTYDKTQLIIDLIADINKEKKICDGIGMQSHISIENPTMTNYNNTIKAFSDAGLAIQITELDVAIKGDKTDAAFALQGQVYRTVIDMYEKYPAISSVTIWGTDDGASWMNKYSPLLLDQYFGRKPAYLGFTKNPSIALLPY